MQAFKSMLESSDQQVQTLTEQLKQAEIVKAQTEDDANNQCSQMENKLEITERSLNDRINMLTESLNEARSAELKLRQENAILNAGKVELGQDTLACMAQNNNDLKELEAKVAAIVSFGGLQNQKSVEEAKSEFDR